MLKRIVEDTIKENFLCSKSDIILVALSGGADSVALLRILFELGYNCKALHCNFHLRGKESDRDETFVKELCNKLNIELEIKHFNTTEYATENGISIEMAARDLRYEWFNQCIKQGKGNYVAVAHHKDDNVETFLINLTRGSGLNGLKGIKIKNNHIIRPLLNVSRSEIIAYLDSIKQKYVIDSTNLENEYIRNKIRLDIIPLFEKINPSFKDSITKTQQHIKEAISIYDDSIKKSISDVLDGNRISIRKLEEQVSPQTVLFEIFHPLGFNPTQISDIYASIKGQSGKRFISHNYEVIKDRDFLIFEKTDKKNDIRIPFEDSAETSSGILKMKCTTKEKFSLIKDKNTACIDKSKIKGRLYIRKWEKGDSFIPLGMKGKKNVSDFLTDIKKNIIEKEKTLVLTDDENIIWIIGERIDDRYKITDKTEIIEIISLDTK